MAGCFSKFCEALVPEHAFGTGEEAERALRFSRCCLFVLYLILGIAFLLSIVTYFAGRVEIVDHRMKFSKLEAPSVAVCPWLSGTSVKEAPAAAYMIKADIYTLDGMKHLPNKPKECHFDRVCQCLDLSDVVLHDVDDDHTGTDGKVSEEIQNFRERIEVHTTLVDPSPAQSLKIGLYDSQDHRPSWFYARQWFFLLGQLRLDSWLVSEAHNQNVWAMLTGNLSSLDRRHYYSYEFSPTDAGMKQAEDALRSTAISYEFRTFFVVETISAHESLSLFTCVALIILLLALSNVLMIWELLFPIYVDGKVRRRVAPPLQWLSSFCCCGKMDHRHDDDPAEQQRDSSTYGATA